MTEYQNQGNTVNLNFIALLKECWALLCDQWFSWVCATFLVALLSAISGIVVLFLLVDWKGWNLLAALSASLIARFALEPGYLQYCLRLASRQEAHLSTLVSACSLGMSFFIATVLFFLAVACGSLFFLIPGLFLLVRFSMYGYVIADRKCGPIVALRESYQMTAALALPLTACLVVCALGAALTHVHFLFELFLFLFFALAYNWGRAK